VQKFHKESYSKQFESPKELGCEEDYLFSII
jgi:hypothetical protein